MGRAKSRTFPKSAWVFCSDALSFSPLLFLTLILIIARALFLSSCGHAKNDTHERHLSNHTTQHNY